MSDVIPDGWDSKTLIDCSVNGISNGVFCDPKKVGSGYKLINVYEMYQGYGVDVNLTRRLQLDEKEFLKNKVNYGDIFFTRSSLKLDGIAYCNINLSHDSDITYDGHLMKIVPNEDVVHSEYLARYCLSDFARTFFMSTAKHSTMTTIAQADIAPLQVLLPPLPEQQKIAAILTSVDDVIEKTQAQIDKLQDLKTGMMQELLTRGVGVDGKPHTEFKDSPVGRIPKGWDVVELGDRASLVPGYAFKSTDFTSNGVPLIRMGNLYNNKLDLTRAPKFLPENFISNHSKFVVHESDIVFSMTGTVGKEDYGFAVQLPKGTILCLLNQRVAKVVTKKLLITNFLLHLLRSRLFLDEIYAVGTGTKQANLSSANILNVVLPFPTIEEQRKIASVLDSIEERITRLKKRHQKQTFLKKALMQDLLTGKVRVKLDS